MFHAPCTYAVKGFVKPHVSLQYFYKGWALQLSNFVAKGRGPIVRFSLDGFDELRLEFKQALVLLGINVQRFPCCRAMNRVQPPVGSQRRDCKRLRTTSNTTVPPKSTVGWERRRQTLHERSHLHDSRLNNMTRKALSNEDAQVLNEGNIASISLDASVCCSVCGAQHL
jgi:hypothetical protein